MRKLLLSTLLAAGLASVARAQDPSILLATGAFVPAATPLVRVPAPAANEIVDGHYYRVIQFHTLPTDAARVALERAGVTLHGYLPATAYTARIPAGISLANLPGAANIRAVFRLDARQKLDAALQSGSFPAHARRAAGRAEAYIHAQPGISEETVRAALAAAGGVVTAVEPHVGVYTALIPANAALRFAALPSVAFVEAAPPAPVPDNHLGRSSHRSNSLAADYSSGLQYNGSGVTVALNDDGIIGPHIDHQGRIGAQYITSNSGNHGDHCAGTIFGAGNRDPRARGMAFGATLRVYVAGSATAAGYQAFDSIYNHYNNLGVRITSTSYSDGQNAGYTARARLMDIHITDLPELMHVFSAGNNGTSGTPSTWYNITGGHKAAKNSMAIGNLDSVDVLNSSSSRGPVHDGRIKPDVCAVGTDVLSTITNNQYDVYTGTSMACPGVSGTLAQLYHAWKSSHGGANPRSALIKAAVINTADDLGNAGPDFRYGFGRINARRAWALLSGAQFFHDSVSQAGTKTHSITVPAGAAELRVTTYWHDRAATAGVAKALVNNLNTTVTTPLLTTVQPWRLNSAANATALNSVATQGVDSLNNVEQITISNPLPGTYTVTVNGAAVPFGPQQYYTVYEVVQPGVTVTYPAGGERFAQGYPEVIRWDAYGGTGTFSVDYSTNGGTSWINIASALPATQRHYTWTPLSTVNSGQMRVRVTRGLQSDVSDTNFSVMGVPTGLTVNWVCVDSMKVSWNAVAGATGYVVTKLGAQYMDSVGASTTTSCVVKNISTATTGWWSVNAIGANSARGRRAVAVTHPAASVNCPVPADFSAVGVFPNLQATIRSCDLTPVTEAVAVQVKNVGAIPYSNLQLNYRVDNGPVVTETYAAPIAPGATIAYNFGTPATFSTAGSYTIRIWTSAPGDPTPLNDTIVTRKDVVFPPTVTGGLAQDFESFPLCDTAANCGAALCTLPNGWRNERSGLDDSTEWRIWSGASPGFLPAGGTGVGSDYNPGTATGRYAYVESSGCAGKTAALTTPCIDLTGVTDPQLRFAYAAYGAQAGGLWVDMLQNGVWTDSIFYHGGDAGLGWKTVTVPLRLDTIAGVQRVVTLRFRAETGAGPLSDFAIDDIRVEAAPTSVAEVAAGLAGLEVFPNPSDGLYTLRAAGLSAAPVAVEVRDAAGRLVLRQEALPVGGRLNMTVDLRRAASGFYLLTVRSAGGTAQHKLTKK